MLEEVAALVHEVWAEYLMHVVTSGSEVEDGTLAIPKRAVEYWLRQMNTSYSELSEEEREWDREIAKRYMGLMGSPRSLSSENQNIWSALLIKMIYDRFIRAGMKRDRVFEWFVEQLATCERG